MNFSHRKSRCQAAENTPASESKRPRIAAAVCVQHSQSDVTTSSHRGPITRTPDVPPAAHPTGSNHQGGGTFAAARRRPIARAKPDVSKNLPPLDPVGMGLWLARHLPGKLAGSLPKMKYVPTLEHRSEPEKQKKR